MMNTKHSLCTCTLSLLLCISIILCTIFACFTYYGTSNGNIIQSDNLQPQMYRTNNLINADANHFLMAAGGDNVDREFSPTEVDSNRSYSFDYWHTHQIEPTLVDYFIPTYKCMGSYFLGFSWQLELATHDRCNISTKLFCCYWATHH